MTCLPRFRVWVAVGLCCLALFTTGCAGSMYGWTVRTTSTPLSPSTEPANLAQGTFAVLTPLSVASLRGNEAGMGQYLGDVIKKVVPNLKVIDERQTISFINKHGLTVEYAQMRSNLELTHILDREILRKIGDATGAQYVFQPRLAHFSQTMTDRWTVPAFNFLASQTRSGTIRLSLQLWEINTGELLWSSTAEANLQSEAVNQDPVFIEDAARVTFGSMLADLLNRRTSSNYTPLNQVLDRLIKEARHTETNGSKNEKPHEPEKSSNEP